MRVLATFLGGVAVAAIAVGCGGDRESGAETEASATALPTVTAPALPSQPTTTATKPAAGGSDAGKQGQSGSSVPEPVTATAKCPPTLTRSECKQLTDALANPTPSQPSKVSCPSTLTRAECKELAAELRRPHPSGTSHVECPSTFTPEQCKELARAVGRSG